ncbi:MAG: ribosomal protein S18-alanine N-acetyltransferase [Candidatus Marinimicrobia bacterium]|jgi:ribosomal-protein-alanine N-acetyltransferase|nr:ribosomal protein S18-alanine N-acetyltransferase [Candidatus Neomarinimicrobiota bacterium]MBT3937805.1 ribosomal protein S18-alanine N-acetyltransferase [Candidatus Neomarinimicrobiota bacterium]MBT3960620.1 ribosomal protein S18-alanine N-acetyltransferase [Candidatus Neomarinimicrobiota bacterium]MBT4383914.1 ribosomal protein S18-alanine N-acetyltransferase [Candidatus Neomarinimicrobiota bacterium]MBT4636034.1 ribosomal protein S18-alanine N-acetyltransferase [Candidatus Neomarinimicro
MIFRIADENDFDSIVNIEVAAFNENAWTKNQLMEELASTKTKKCYVLEHNNEIIGYLMCRQIMDEHEIINVAILPSIQGEGYGKLILEKYFDSIPDESSVFLDVKRTNYPAIKLYLGCGFEEIDIRQNYYHDGEDAIVMKKGNIKSHVMV